MSLCWGIRACSIIRSYARTGSQTLKHEGWTWCFGETGFWKIDGLLEVEFCFPKLWLCSGVTRETYRLWLMIAGVILATVYSSIIDRLRILTHTFVIKKKKSNRWRLLTGFTKGWWGYRTYKSITTCLLIPTAIPRNTYRIITALKDCFYGISSHPGDCEKTFI